MNIWSNRKKLKEVVKHLREAKLLSEYKTVLPSHRWQLLVSQVALYFEGSLKTKDLLASEKLLLTQPPASLFQHTLSRLEFSNPALKKVNWSALEEFLRLSLFWESFRKTGVANSVFTSHNQVEQNQRKREAFNSWWTSLALVDTSFNSHVFFILSLTG